MEKFSSLVQVVLLCTVLFLCLVVVMLVMNNIDEKAFKDFSGWAQAIGGFLAIGAAFLVGNLQAAAAIAAVERSAQLEHVSKWNALLSVAGELERVSEQAYITHETQHTLAIAISRIQWGLRFDFLLDELRRVEANEFGDQEVLVAVIRLKVASTCLKNALDKMPAAVKAAIDDENDKQEQFNHLLNVIDLNRIEIAGASKILNGKFEDLAVAQP